MSPIKRYKHISGATKELCIKRAQILYLMTELQKSLGTKILLWFTPYFSGIFSDIFAAVQKHQRKLQEHPNKSSFGKETPHIRAICIWPIFFQIIGVFNLVVCVQRGDSFKQFSFFSGKSAKKNSWIHQLFPMFLVS